MGGAQSGAAQAAPAAAWQPLLPRPTAARRCAYSPSSAATQGPGEACSVPAQRTATGLGNLASAASARRRRVAAPQPTRPPCLLVCRCGHTLTTIAGPDGDLTSAKLILFGGWCSRGGRWRSSGTHTGPAPTTAPTTAPVRARRRQQTFSPHLNFLFCCRRRDGSGRAGQGRCPALPRPLQRR